MMVPSTVKVVHSVVLDINMASLLVILCLLSFTAGQPAPYFHRQQDGSLRVVVPGVPGVSKLTLTVSGKESQIRSYPTSKTVDGNWWTRIPDVTSKDDDTLHYVIHYRLQDNVHKVEGSVRLKDKSTAVMAPVSPRHLRRRSTVVFSDDFRSATIDLTKWTQMINGFGGGINQVNMYTPEPVNAFIRHGILYIKPTLTVDHFGDDFLQNGDLNVSAIWGVCKSIDNRGCELKGPGHIPPIMSAMLRSKGHIRYGRVSVEARLPKGDWLWPAIWLLPTEYHYGPWPRSGEIDIMESRGNMHIVNRWNNRSMGPDYAHTGIIYGTNYDKAHRAHHAAEYWLHSGTFADRFHTWWMDWTENYIKLGVDDHTILASDTPSQGFFQESHFHGDNVWANGGKDAPFDQPFDLILNVQVGGGFFWPDLINAAYPQPYNITSPKAQQFIDFWNARHLWEPTWHGDNVAMRIRKVTMEQY